jgi:hypothetical protein
MLTSNVETAQDNPATVLAPDVAGCLADLRRRDAERRERQRWRFEAHGGDCCCDECAADGVVSLSDIIDEAFACRGLATAPAG